MDQEKINELSKKMTELTVALKIEKGKTYTFDEISPEGLLSDEIKFRKYLLKCQDSDFISTEELKSGTELRDILDSTIADVLGKEFINISFIDKSSRSSYSDGVEHFSILFRKTYDGTKCGAIRTFRVDDRPEKIKLGEKTNNRSGIEINVDFLRTACLKYTGPDFANCNVLIFGVNIEENPYIVELLNSFPPKNLLNIVPLGSMRSFFDNVD